MSHSNLNSHCESQNLYFLKVSWSVPHDRYLADTFKKATMSLIHKALSLLVTLVKEKHIYFPC